MDRPSPPPVSRERMQSARSAIGSFIVMDIMHQAALREAAGESIIHMEVGQPGTPAPRKARAAAARALENDTLGYTLALGLPELREGIAGLYKTWYGIDVAPERVIVTTGSSAAFVLAFLSLFDAGQSVGLTQPGYPCYRQILKSLDCRAEFFDVGPQTGWMPSLDALASRPNLDGLLLASPANPTGTMLDRERLAGICRLCAARGIPFISDEIYHGLTYDVPASTALEFSSDVIVINSFSKYFSMTGWRVGWMIVPQHLVRVVERVAQNLYISAPAISQLAAIAALDATEELEANRAVYAANRALLLNELPKAGFRDFAPADGAFYLYSNISNFGCASGDLVHEILERTGVAVTPGLDFDAVCGADYVRFSYAGTTAKMAEAAHRLQSWYRSRS